MDDKPFVTVILRKELYLTEIGTFSATAQYFTKNNQKKNMQKSALTNLSVTAWVRGYTYVYICAFMYIYFFVVASQIFNPTSAPCMPLTLPFVFFVFTTFWR